MIGDCKTTSSSHEIFPFSGLYMKSFLKYITFCIVKLSVIPFSKLLRSRGGTLDIETITEDRLKLNVTLSGLKVDDSATDILATLDEQIWQEYIPINKELFEGLPSLTLRALDV